MNPSPLNVQFVKHSINGIDVLVPTKQAAEELAIGLYALGGSFGRHPQQLQIGGKFDTGRYMYFGTEDIDLDAAPFTDADIGKAYTFIECGEISYWGYDGFESDGTTPAIAKLTIEAESGGCSVLMLVDRHEGDNIFQLVNNASLGTAPNPPSPLPSFSVSVINGATDKFMARESEIVAITAVPPLPLNFAVTAVNGTASRPMAFEADIVAITAIEPPPPIFTVAVLNGSANRRAARENEIITLTTENP